MTRPTLAILDRYLNAVPGRRYPDIHADFVRVAPLASPELIAIGLRRAFEAKSSVPLPVVIARLYRTADPTLRRALAELIGNGNAAKESNGARVPLVLQQAAVTRSVRVALRGDRASLESMAALLAAHRGLATCLDGIAMTHVMIAMASERDRTRRRRRRARVTPVESS